MSFLSSKQLDLLTDNHWNIIPNFTLNMQRLKIFFFCLFFCLWWHKWLCVWLLQHLTFVSCKPNKIKSVFVTLLGKHVRNKLNHYKPMWIWLIYCLYIIGLVSIILNWKTVFLILLIVGFLCCPSSSVLGPLDFIDCYSKSFNHYWASSAVFTNKSWVLAAIQTFIPKNCGFQCFSNFS